MRFKLTREMQIPKGAIKVADKQSDAIAYLYPSAQNGKPAVMMFWGKSDKPILRCYFNKPEQRETRIAELFSNRRDQLARKAAYRAQRTAYVHDYKVGEILHTCWGYDQTNVEYFQIIEVRGKHVVVREIECASKDTGFMQGQSVPLKDKFLQPRHAGDDRGQPLRRLAGQHGVKIDDVRTAFRDKGTTVAGMTVYAPKSWSSYA